MAQVHPTLREPQPNGGQIWPAEPVYHDPPIWVPPPSSRTDEILGRIKYFGFAVLIAALLVALPVALLLTQASETSELDDEALTGLLASGVDFDEPSDYSPGHVPVLKPGGVSLTVDSTPDGAVVLVDYDSIGVTPLIGHRLNRGVYVLSMRKEGYAPLDTVLFVDEHTAAAPVLSISLRQVERTNSGTATPEARSIVSAERVARPREQVEQRTLRAQEAESGAERADQLSRRARAEQADQRETSQETADRTEPVALTGTLTVLVRPWGSIYIDGTLHQRETDIQYTATLSVGRHHVRVEHPALGTRETEVEIGADRPVNLVFDLLPRGEVGDGN